MSDFLVWVCLKFPEEVRFVRVAPPIWVSAVVEAEAAKEVVPSVPEVVPEEEEESREARGKVMDPETISR